MKTVMNIAPSTSHRLQSRLKPVFKTPIHHSTFEYRHFPSTPSHPFPAPRPGPTRPGPFKSNFLAVLACVMIAGGVVAQDKPTPEFKALKDQFEAQVKLDVHLPYDLGVVDLNIKYTAALERALAMAQQSGKLEEAVAIKGDKEAVALGRGVPATDDDETPPGVKQLRNTYRLAISRLELARVRRLQPLQAAYARSLDPLITSLTKEGKFDEAMAVKKHRAELAADVPAAALATLAKPPVVGSPASSATKENPFVNSLGMKFVPVPETTILMCIHETRYKDYAAYAARSSGADGSWKDQSADGFVLSERAEDHPVMNVSWEDAQNFCAWLSKKESKAYRLPTDKEWSIAVGIGGKSQTEFPWGDKWPPPEGAGNYSDLSRKEKFPQVGFIGGYTDGFPTTAPVMSFKPNALGLYDLGGNVWELCGDFNDNAKKDCVRRGGGWNYLDRPFLVSSIRIRSLPGSRLINLGFRVVVKP